jgi:hypothetical protein
MSSTFEEFLWFANSLCMHRFKDPVCQQTGHSSKHRGLSSRACELKREILLYESTFGQSRSWSPELTSLRVPLKLNGVDARGTKQIVTRMNYNRRGLDWQLDMLNTYRSSSQSAVSLTVAADWTLVLSSNEVKVEVNLRPTVSRPVYLGVRHPSGTRNQFFFLLEISFVEPSLTRGRVCNLPYNCFWALPEQSLLGRSPTELTAIFYCLIWDSPNLEGQVPVFISPRNMLAQLYPRALMAAGHSYIASARTEQRTPLTTALLLLRTCLLRPLRSNCRCLLSYYLVTAVV